MWFQLFFSWTCDQFMAAYSCSEGISTHMNETASIYKHSTSILDVCSSMSMSRVDMWETEQGDIQQMFYWTELFYS